MPKLTVSGTQTDVVAGTRLVLAIEAAGVAIGHRCGGQGRCTTCRVTFSEGEPETFTGAEYRKLGLEAGQEPDYRLSCQIVCRHDMHVDALMTLDTQSWSDTGPEPSEQVQPEAVWHTRTELEADSAQHP